MEETGARGGENDWIRDLGWDVGKRARGARECILKVELVTTLKIVLKCPRGRAARARHA